MKRAYLALRSASLWFLSLLHFFIAAPTLVLLGIFLDPRKHDWLQRAFCRRIAFLSGARVEVRRSPGFDPQRTSFFMVNHVNVFDPFILYCAIPQYVRGWELESHFKIPAYGWLMKRFGNVPVPDVRRPSDLKRMWRLTQDAIDGGTSLIIFPEAKRTRDGHAAARRPDRSRKPSGLVPPPSHRSLDALARHGYRRSPRHHRHQGPPQRRRPRSPRTHPRNHLRPGRGLAKNGN